MVRPGVAGARGSRAALRIGEGAGGSIPDGRRLLAALERPTSSATSRLRPCKASHSGRGCGGARHCSHRGSGIHAQGALGPCGPEQSGSPTRSTSSLMLGQGEGSGEAVATYLGYALEGTDPLRWLDGWEYLEEGVRRRPERAEPRDGPRYRRRVRAGYFLDGSIVRGPDSVTVVLRLHDVQGVSVLRRAGASAPAASGSLPQLGSCGLMGELLPALLEPWPAYDLSALSERRPAAVASFLRGERQYRSLLFDSALVQYRAALH